MKKMWLILAAALLAPSIFADPPPPQRDNIPRPNANSMQMRDFFSSLKDEERKELRELQRDNPDEFKKQMEVRLNKYNAERLEREKKLNELVRTYQSSESTKEAKDKAYAEIKKITTEEFERNLKEHKRQLEFLEKKLERERERYQSRSQNAEKIIQVRVDELTKPPELRW